MIEDTRKVRFKIRVSEKFNKGSFSLGVNLHKESYDDGVQRYIAFSIFKRNVFIGIMK